MKGFLVGGSAATLVNDLFIPMQAICLQRAKDVIGSTFDIARGIDILDA